VSESAMFCEHANEVPLACPCTATCYCKSHTCANRADDKPEEPCPEPDFDNIEWLRKLLSGYDRGILSPGEVSIRALRSLLKPHLDHLQEHPESIWGGGWCGGEPPPARRAVIEVGASYVKVTRIDEAQVKPEAFTECPGGECPMCSGDECAVCKTRYGVGEMQPVCTHTSEERHHGPS
jgi:hypothetical protein